MKYSLIFTLFISTLFTKEFRVITNEYNHGLGMFGAANQVLSQLYLFEARLLPTVSGITVDLKKNGLYYDPSYGPNWWTYYFEPICVGSAKNATIVYPTSEQYTDALVKRRRITRKAAAQIVKKHIHIKPHIQEKIDAFISQFFLGRYVIGIHYRGTDKCKEAPRVAYKTIFEEINKRIPQEKLYALFIATDEVEFLEQAQEKYPNQVIATESHRANNGNIGVHFSNKNNYILGEEALIDAYLLSKCDVLIRTSSNLSLWSTYFNPDLPVILLSQRFMKTLEPE